MVNVYDNWNDANTNNAFCTDSTSCIDILAECKMYPQQPTAKYCQCPDGYKVTDDNKRCGKEFQRIFFSFKIIYCCYRPI